MSEVLHQYPRHARYRVLRRRKDPRHRGRGCAIVLLLAVLGLVWVLWTTRDSCPIERAIPGDQKYRVYALDFLERRMEIARSQVWTLAPEGSLAAGIPALLSSSFNMPEWVLNNLVGGMCHVSGRDAEGFSDALFVTHMSRIGCLIERCHRFIPGIDVDHAGGLRLRAIPHAGLYYAVRGRTLAVSRSRDALIRSLTLAEEDALGREALERGIREMGSDDLYGHMNPDPDDPLGRVFESLDVSVDVTPTAAHLAVRGRLRPMWRQRLSGILDGAIPVPLEAPPEGLVSASINVGKPLSEVCNGVIRALGYETSLQDLLPEERRIPLDVVAGLLDHVGPGMRLSWRGMDLNEMMPVPEFVGTFDADPAYVTDLFAAVPAPPGGAGPWEMLPRHDAEKGIVWLPLIGGPSMEPTAALYGDELLVSSSRTVAEALLDAGPHPEQLPEKANLYLRLSPHPCVQAAVDTGLEFARFGALRGYTPESLTEAAAPWLELARRITEVTALLSHQDGELCLALRFAVLSPPAQP